MITFVLAILALVVGYLLYGRFVERVFAPDDRPTPALQRADGVDFMPMPNWRIFMIQFLNIAGTGPIFGAIMGAKFGTAAYLWIVFGCIFAGATHDYLSGMLSLRNGGIGLPEIIKKYLGVGTKNVMLVFSVFLLIMVGVVFVYSPAEIMKHIWGSSMFWIVVIFIYYIIATMLPIDKIIGRVYPFFAAVLLFMAAGLMICLFVKWPALPEIWQGVGNLGKKTAGEGFDPIFPCLFITIACGAISGFHATQSPLMARCLKSERMGRPIFYGAMITEGIVALIWATISMYFFYDFNEPGMQTLAGAAGNNGFMTSAPSVVNIICNSWLGVFGGILALLGVVAAPITSGDTAFRSARLIISEQFKINQGPVLGRLSISIPLFVVAIALLIWQVEKPNGFNVIWQYFGWANQTLSVFTLWTITVFLALSKKPFVITLIPALFMTVICSTFLVVSPIAFGQGSTFGYIFAIAVLLVAAVWFCVWYRRATRRSYLG